VNGRELELAEWCHFNDKSLWLDGIGRTSCCPDTDALLVNQRDVAAVFVWQINSRDSAPCQPSCFANSFGIVGLDNKTFSSW